MSNFLARPGGELLDGLDIGRSCVGVAVLGGEDLDEALGHVRAGLGEKGWDVQAAGLQ